MKHLLKLLLCPVACLLFYLNTLAQITKTINGTVRYQSGISETQFTTPYGNVKVDLPQSLSGAVISGTVTAEPTGKNQKEKDRNLKDLLKMTLAIDDQKIPLNQIPFLFDWKPSLGTGQRTPVRLTNFLGTEIGEVSLPPVIITPHIVNPQEPEQLSTPSTVMVKGDLLNVYTNKAFTPGEKFVIIDGKGEQFILKPKCFSAQQAVIELPENIAPGSITVTEEVWNQPVQSFDIRSAKTTLVDLTISSPNTNLRPRQKSEVIVNCIVTDSKGEWVNPDIEKLINGTMTIDLRNLNPNTVTMEGGNLQRVYGKDFASVSSNEVAKICWQIKRGITGNAVGIFSVSATLRENYSTSNDPFRPQLNVLKTPEDFNAWANALKKDLNQYTTRVTDDDGGTSQDISVIRSNVQRAIGNMPVCTSQEQLDESKAVAYSLLQPLNVPKGAAISWLSSYEALKAVVNNSTGNTTLTDFDVLKNGIEFINRVAQYYKETALQTECGHVQDFIDSVQTTGETKENLQQLKDKINGLTTRADMKIATDDQITLRTGMKDLILSSYQLPSLAQPGRVHPYNDLMGFLNLEKKTLFVLPEYKSIVLSMIKAEPLPNGQYHINSMTLNRNPIDYDIAIVVANQFLLFDEAGKKPDETKKDEVKTEPKKEPATFVKKFFNGSLYCFLYKDAECVHERDAKKDDVCTLIPGAKPDDPNAGYMKTEYLARGYCKKGTGTCIEMLTVDYITHHYTDKNCKILLGVTSHSSYSCE
ncbi:MAG: hypothetical protein HZB42_07325 [Sphingobacteriales bacterium]|nr:hypothetical protein [Sphingobacteriales bacterium]